MLHEAPRGRSASGAICLGNAANWLRFEPATGRFGCRRWKRRGRRMGLHLGPAGSAPLACYGRPPVLPFLRFKPQLAGPTIQREIAPNMQPARIPSQG